MQPDFGIQPGNFADQRLDAVHPVPKLPLALPVLERGNCTAPFGGSPSRYAGLRSGSGSSSDAALDNDRDGLTNLEELQAGTNPNVNEAAVLQIINTILVDYKLLRFKRMAVDFLAPP